MTRICLGALVPLVVVATSLRSKPQSTADRVARLLNDIDESVHKAGEDSEVVFATFYTYDQALESSLTKEVSTLNVTSKKLAAMRQAYLSEANRSRNEAGHLAVRVNGSRKMALKMEVGTKRTNQTFNKVLNSVHQLSSLLQGAAVMNGALVTPEVLDEHGEPSKVYGAIRQLLAAYPKLETKFEDVFFAFAPTSLAQTPDNVHPRVHMTPVLLQHTISALASIQEGLNDQKSKALADLESQKTKYDIASETAEASAEAQKSTVVEKDQKAEELSFSIGFTEDVLRLDTDLLAKVREHMKAKLDLTDEIRNMRQNQLLALKDLVNLLKGSSASPVLAPSLLKVHPLAEGVEFVQVMSRTSLRSRSRRLASLQPEIDSTLQNKANTHGILLKIRAILDASMPPDVSSVQGAVAELGAVLQKLESEHSKAADAKRTCASEQTHAHGVEQGLTSSLALMKSAQNQTQAAISAAKSNLRDIQIKSAALTRSAKDFSKVATTNLKTLDQQAKDRGTILTALRKASEVVAHGLPQLPSAIALLMQLMKSMQTQDDRECSFREHERSMEEVFAQYVSDYVELLNQRQSHYESALSDFEWYASELANDATLQSNSLGVNSALTSESRSLCTNVLAFYANHDKRRSDLGKMLRAVIPKMPELYSLSAE